MAVPMLGTVFSLYEQKNFKRAQNVKTLIKRVASIEEKTGPELTAALAGVPYPEIREKVEPDLSDWKPGILDSLIEQGVVTPTTAKQYYRDLRDFLKFGDAITGKASRPPLGEEWSRFIAPFAIICPTTLEEIQRLLENGITRIAGYDTTGKPLGKIQTRLENKRTHLRRFAHECEDAGLDPHAFGRLVLEPKDFARLPILRNKPVAGKQIGFYDVREIWNELAPLYAADLPSWEGHVTRDGLPFEEWPEPLQQAWRLVYPEPSDRKKRNTWKHRLSAMRLYLGKIQKLGVSLELLVAGLTGKDPLRLVTQGIPRVIASRLPETDDHMALARKLEMDAPFRDEVLAAMRDLEDSYEGRGSVRNPFVALILRERENAGQYPSALALIKLVSVTCRTHFNLCGPHVKWIEKDVDRAEELCTENPSPHELEKREIFKHPELWMKLVQRQIQIVNHLLGKPSSSSQKWATKVRLVLFVTMLLLFPLRIQNYRGMKIDTNLDSARHSLHFESHETKNGSAIDFTFPEKGPLACLRALMRLYLDKARPLLLQEVESEYLFVPDQRLESAGPQMSEKSFNDLLADYSISYFRDILPERIAHLCPHFARHLAATHWVCLGREDRAAQVLGDTVETIRRNYSDARYAANRALKEYYDSFGDEFEIC